MTEPTRKPSVLFVCVKNGGKSQMAAGLMRQAAGTSVEVDSAGTEPGTAVNALSAETLLEVGVDITGQAPKALTDELIAAADVIVVLGRDAQVEPADGKPVQIWDTDEPSERGIDGIERMRLVRDDIARHVDRLVAGLLPGSTKDNPTVRPPVPPTEKGF
jgi:arsenate-mycothiol transferase